MSQAIALDRVSKRYGATVALTEVSFAVREGNVHAMLGENGAGKSTLVKILSGIVQPDAGNITIFGAVSTFPDRETSSRNGLETAFQEVPLVPDLTVQDNLLLPHIPTRWGVFRDGAAARRRVAEIFSAVEIDDVDPRAVVRDLDLSMRQKIEIARSIARNPRILILDEPTASLSLHDVAWLGRRIRALAAAGTTIILVTHRMQEVREFCGSMSILRNGAHVASFESPDVADDEVFRLIMGRSVSVAFPPRRVRSAAVVPAAPRLRAMHLSVRGRLDDVSLQLSAGEVVGVAALQGMGQLALFNALFGAERLAHGRVSVNDADIELLSPRDAIRAGIALVPEDRKIQGLALQLSGCVNATLPIAERFASFGIMRERDERAAVDAVFATVNLHPRALYQRAGAFSGGNQQKIVLAKWLLTHCQVLLAFDPTRGVDVGTKHEMYGLLRSFADRGGAVLFHSTEIPELIGVCDRVLVLYRGQLAAELAAAELSVERIAALMLGAGYSGSSAQESVH